MWYLIRSMLLQLLVELQGDADHHFGLVPVWVGDVVQDAIEICSREKHVVTDESQTPDPGSAPAPAASCVIFINTFIISVNFTRS